MQSQESQEKEYAMNITRDHTPFAQVCVLARDRKHACVIDLLACMYVQLLIIENESSSVLQANCQPANTKPSATVTRAVWYSINSLPHMQLYIAS